MGARIKALLPYDRCHDQGPQSQGNGKDASPLPAGFGEILFGGQFGQVNISPEVNSQIWEFM